ncbi:hypothetical protein FHG87_008021 [Trinorchestia longiramus]|nr:hypothetical protein FHG87_008021 [Trinorchestia longiramus]
MKLSYERHLQQLELISLEQRKLRGQLIDTYNYIDGFNDVTLEGIFHSDDKVRPRNNDHKLIRRTYTTSQALNVFPVKITRAKIRTVTDSFKLIIGTHLESYGPTTKLSHVRTFIVRTVQQQQLKSSKFSL